MSELHPPPLTMSKESRHWTRTELIVGAVALVLLGFYLWIVRGVIEDRELEYHVMFNSRHIAHAMNQWAADHGGAYPEGDTANEVFRQMIIDGHARDERWFGAYEFNADGDMGDAPSFARALQPGECGFMIVGWKSANDEAVRPLVFENALSATLPLKWNTDHPKTPGRGRTNSGGRIYMGMTDGSGRCVKADAPDNPLLHLPAGTRMLDIETSEP